MTPLIFPLVAADAGVQSALGASPCRFYPFGEAPEGVTRPYSTWTQITGSPENYLDKRPDYDTYQIQIDVFGLTVASVRDAAKALRDAIEPAAYITSWDGESKEADTHLYRVIFSVEWQQPRT